MRVDQQKMNKNQQRVAKESKNQKLVNNVGQLFTHSNYLTF